MIRVPRDLAGRTVVVTGASSGTGAAAARLLAARGATLAVVGRDALRTRTVADAVGGRPFLADFTQLGTVRRLADELTGTYPRIDVLADNAGAAVVPTAPTVDGNEANYQVNALAPILLITSLTPALRAAGGRIVSTSSRSHKGASLHRGRVAQQLDDPTRLGPHRRYARAKLAALLLHRAYARRHPDVPVADFHPGIVASDFGRYLGRRGAIASALARPFLVSPSTAAARLIALATTAGPVGGRYFVGGAPAQPHPLVADDGLAEEVWRDADRRVDGALSRS